MSRNDDAKQMTRAALRLIEGSDFPWARADIIADPVRRGRWISDFMMQDATNDEVLRTTVRIQGEYLGRGGFVEFESKCELHNYRSMWEPRFVDVKIGDGDTNRHFYYINEWREGRYNLTIKESSPATATA